MIKNVKNISRSLFNKMNFYRTSENPTKETHAYISIYGSSYEEQTAPKINHLLWYDGVQLKFDDVCFDNKSFGLETISEQQSYTLVEFVNKIHRLPNEMTLIIHCFAGISRSAGVGKFVNDVFNLNLPHYAHLNLYNLAVYQSLNRAYIRFLEDDASTQTD